jgi:hypothetical protein
VSFLAGGKLTNKRYRSHIQGRVQISNELKQLKLGEEPTKGQELIHAVHKVSSLCVDRYSVLKNILIHRIL